ncbi:EAL domain-containing protein [Candidatus Thiodiazotropha sp. CDECU1]|uniref:EAL domain-containing protein n=1 Tax=Candidatus Thiodiazotropha sp. CDECU1 TaxID=3065865 RepID=UPI002931D9CB|nr:EAL domain-containing protein [Candidatus Thiodiazotropha sp. CDECU1]
MARNLQFRYTVAIGAVIVIVTVILATLFFFQSKELLSNIKTTTTSTMSTALHDEAKKRLMNLSAILSEDLSNPLYNFDMLAILQLLQSVAKLDDIAHVMVIDPKGVIVHDGTELLDSYGKQLEEREILDWIEKQSAPLLINSEELMEIVSPVHIADERLGWVRIALFKKAQLENTQKLTQQLSNLTAESQQRERYLLYLVTTVLLLLGLGLAALISNRLVSPIRKLTEYVKRVGEGAYGIELDRNRSDEIGQLIHSFNRMSRDLSNTSVSRQYLNDVLNNLCDALIVVSDDMKILMVNNAATEMIGFDKQRLESMSYYDLIDSRDGVRVKRWLSRLLEQQIESIDARYITAAGSHVLVSLSGAYLDLSGAPGQIITVAQDVSERRKNEEHIRYLAQYDGLTNLPNRQLFRDRLKHAMKQAERGEYLIALMFIDLDRFKKVNDSLGHQAGDLLLKETAVRLKKLLRLGDTVARLGGDEFTIIAEQIKSINDGVNIATTILETVKEPFEIDTRKVHIGCSIGIVFYPFATDDIGSLVQKADMAMYQAKRNGRGQYCVYNHMLGAHENGVLQQESELMEALKTKSFHLLYQPVVDTSTGATVGMEALLRWDNPRRGILDPTEFLPFLENSGFIIELGDWILERACREMLDYSESSDSPLQLNVNVSMHQFNQGDFSHRVESILNKTGFDPKRLELEITESSLIEDIEMSRNVVRSLKKLGIRIAVDDFGTGYSSFSYLRDFTLDTLKLDTSFIKGLPNDNYAIGICTALIKMAEIMQLNVVAEGVENQQQVAWLHSENVDQCQGYYFGEPAVLGE